MKLTNPTDDELNAAFAEKVCGWERISEAVNVAFIIPATGAQGTPPEFCRFVDAVLPWLEKMPHWQNESVSYGTPETRHFCRVFMAPQKGLIGDKLYLAKADTFPRAAVIALLRAHGVEIEVTL